MATAKVYSGNREALAAELEAVAASSWRPSSRDTTRRTPTCSRERCASQADVLGFAAGLEKGAVSAYLGAVPLFGARELARAAASILGDEAMHLAVLRQALGENPVPWAFVS
jgi:hypothetical protein